MGIADANNAGNVHGGLIMHLCDEVAGIAAVRHSGSRVVTAAMDRMNFRHPVYVGQLVTVKATVNAAWRSSMEVGVRVESENVRSGEVLHTSTAYLTMVALDDEGNPTRGSAGRSRDARRDSAGPRGPAAPGHPPGRAAEDRGGAGSRLMFGSWRHSVNLPCGSCSGPSRAAAAAARSLAQPEGGEHCAARPFNRIRSAQAGVEVPRVGRRSRNGWPWSMIARPRSSRRPARSPAAPGRAASRGSPGRRRSAASLGCRRRRILP